MQSDGNVRIETVRVDSSTRQIGPASRTTALLQDRRSDIESAIVETTSIVQDSVANIESHQDWKVRRLEAKFGLTLAAEAGVLISRASAEASLEVRIVVERDS